MERTYLQVEDNSDLVRDTHSNVIVNTNRNAYEIAVKRAKEELKDREMKYVMQQER